MHLTAEHQAQLLAVDAYAISLMGRMDPRKGDQGEPWLDRELLLTVVISGFGETSGNSTVTWQAQASGETIEQALERALLFAPAALAEANARAAGRLGSILPEYDPDNSRKRSKAPAKKISLDQLNDLLGGL